MRFDDRLSNSRISIINHSVIYSLVIYSAISLLTSLLIIYIRQDLVAIILVL
jgi:hypothetical protein